MNWKQAFSIGVIPPGLWDGKGEQWETLEDGIVEPTMGYAKSDTKYIDYSNGWIGHWWSYRESCTYSKMHIGDIIRITVNGVSETFAFEKFSYTENNPAYCPAAGNIWLIQAESGVLYEDNGYDYAVQQAVVLDYYLPENDPGYGLILFTRQHNSNPINVKIERKL